MSSATYSSTSAIVPAGHRLLKVHCRISVEHNPALQYRRDIGDVGLFIDHITINDLLQGRDRVTTLLA